MQYPTLTKVAAAAVAALVVCAVLSFVVTRLVLHV